ncbi:DUF692 domain-containing protein [Streptomyces sp. DSM 41014]|uniref:DUF692 domain-containing protein n=1 Tax=Streptomyces hintoniae TaxID=3075521 RepID=A0ABU2UD57_9ACTN|nr:DUF692 domain-containing protein [Streptomyces sp. DSM 41014]MDT0471069.1 DUF692 domain-containing protein [Streptomyces sp. DSM 41014]
MTSAPEKTEEAFVRIQGAGLGYRKELSKEFYTQRARIDVVEVLADQWFGDGNRERLREIADTFPTVVHGVGMSVGGAGRISEDYLKDAREAVRVCDASFYSEHLAVTHIPGMNSGHLCPPVISDESLKVCIRNVEQAQDFLGVPLALENITYSMTLGADHSAAASFFGDIVQATECLILLDVANLYINSRNHQFDPLKYLDLLPVERVVQIHLAGGIVSDTGKYIDSHSEQVGQEIWELASAVAVRVKPDSVIIERDQNFPDFDSLLDDVAAARGIFFPSV